MKVIWTKEKIKAFLAKSDPTNKPEGKEDFKKDIQKAATDPDFRRDVEDTMRDFARIDQLEESKPIGNR